METRAKAAGTQREAEEPPRTASSEASAIKMKQGGLKKGEGYSWGPQGPRVARNRTGASGKSAVIVAGVQEEHPSLVSLPAVTEVVEATGGLVSREKFKEEETAALEPSPAAASSIGAIPDGAAPLHRLQQLQERCLVEATKLPTCSNVHFNSDIGTLGWTGARLGGPNESPQIKSFSVLSYGFQEARRLATVWAEGTTSDQSRHPPADGTSSSTTGEAPAAVNSIHSSGAATTTPPATAAIPTATAATTTTETADVMPEGTAPAVRKPGRPRKTKDRRRGSKETSDCAGHVDSSAPEEDAEKVTVSLLRESLTVMIDDLVDLCSPRLRSALTPDQRNKYYGPLREHAKHIRETRDVSDLIEYMRLYFDRYMMEKIVPSEDPCYARVFALLNALAVWAPPVAGCMRFGVPSKAINLGSVTSGRTDLLEDILSDRSSSMGTDGETQQPSGDKRKLRGRAGARPRAAKKRRP